MKINKSELKEMLREAIREELANTKRPIKESISDDYDRIKELWYDGRIPGPISQYQYIWDKATERKILVRNTGKGFEPVVFKPISEVQEALKEPRSVADIEAEIARLQQELADAKAVEKKASYGGTLPTFVYAWDMYTDPANKGDWVSTNYDTVFETENKAIDAGCLLLSELADEGELGDEDEYVEPDDYTVGVIKIPLATVPAEMLRYSNLNHLIDESAVHRKCRCPRCGNNFYTSQTDWDANKITCWVCSTVLHHK